MNVEFINPFLSSIANVLATMAMLEIKPGKIHLDDGSIPKADVTGLISMKSPKAEGTLAISFTDKSLQAITERMLGEAVGADDTECIDNMLGEITNMVTGGAKQILETRGFDFDMALPTVLRGEQGDYIHTQEGDKVVVVPFASDLGDFYVSICFKSPKPLM